MQKKNVKPFTKKQKDTIKQMIDKDVTGDLKVKLSPETAIGNNPDNTGAVSFASSGYGSSASLTCISGAITQGTAINNRIGNKIRLRRVTIKASVEPGDNTNWYRLLLFKWKQNRMSNQSSFANIVANVLSGATSASNQYCAPVDHRAITTLWDHTYHLKYAPIDGSTNTSVPGQVANINIDLKMDHMVLWDAVSNGNFGSDIWMMAISDSAAIAHPGWTHGIIGVWFTDE